MSAIGEQRTFVSGMNYWLGATILNYSFFEQFLSPMTMVEAERSLIQMGKNAIPLLEALLNGDAKNDFGVPYRDLGLPLRCGLEVMVRLGQVAKPLEPAIAKELANGNPAAAMALGSLGSLEPASIAILANSLEGNTELSYESAAALLRCNESRNQVILAKINQSKQVEVILQKVNDLLGTQS